MRINLIGNFNSRGLIQDSQILRGLLSNFYGENLEIRRVQHILPECPQAELNIFLEVINPALFIFASKNIYLPNIEWTYKTWIPYLKEFDEIWVKTLEAQQIFSEYSEKVKFLGWTSIDKEFKEKKNYSKAIVLVGKNMYRNPKPLLKAYYDIYHNEIANVYKLLPELHIPYNPQEVDFFVPDEIKSKVILYKEQLLEKEYDNLLHECGLAICLSATEGFCHCVNEALSAGCNLLLSPIKPFKELDSQEILYTSEFQVLDNPDCLGTLIDTNSKSIIELLKEYISRSMTTKKQISLNLREIYEQRHSDFIQQFLGNLQKDIPDYSLEKLLPSESDLPDISIITLTYNRRVFMPLAKYSYLIQSYPEDKLEWIIVDDGTEEIEDTLIGIPNVKYIKLPEKTSIGQKRNIGIENAMYDYICMMDDDDVYPNNSILQRIIMLLKQPLKQCTFCTTIPCYDIEKYSSFMNVPPITLKMSQRVSEATLCFTKQFWEERKFDSNTNVGEGEAFIHGREHMCREISPQEVIVSLVHSKNTSSRKLPNIPESNGCHYGFNEKLFATVSEIGESLKAHLSE